PPAMPSLTPADFSSALAATPAATERCFAGDRGNAPRFAAIGQAEHMITSTAIAIHKNTEPLWSGVIDPPAPMEKGRPRDLHIGTWGDAHHHADGHHPCGPRRGDPRLAKLKRPSRILPACAHGDH